MNVTIHDLARLAGLNSSTISRALRNDPRVRQSTRDKIHALAEKYGYTPNLNARNLADGKTRMIAFLMGSLDFQLGREAAVTLNDIFSQYGYTLMIFSYAPDPERFYADRLEKLTQKICDGAILTAPDYTIQSDRILSLLKAVKIPLICLDRWFPNHPLPVVTTDNTIAIPRLCQRALEAGIDGAVIDFPATDTVSESRREETVKFLEAKGIPFIFPEEGCDISGFLRRNRIHKAAVFANNCLLEQPWTELLPPDFIAVGFDTEHAPEQHSGAVFRCIQDYRTVADTAARLLLKQLDDSAAIPETPVLVPPAAIV